MVANLPYYSVGWTVFWQVLLLVLSILVDPGHDRMDHLDGCNKNVVDNVLSLLLWQRAKTSPRTALFQVRGSFLLYLYNDAFQASFEKYSQTDVLPNGALF